MKDPQAIKAILIPAAPDESLALVDVPDSSKPRAFAAVIRCAYIERVTTILTGLHGLVLLVDEDGVYATPQIHNRRASLLVGPLAHIVGDALLVREDSHGEWHTPRAPRCTLGMVRNLVEIVDDVAQEATL